MGLQLTLHTAPEVPLEAEVLSVDALTGLKPAAVEKAAVRYGNRSAVVGDFFGVNTTEAADVRLRGDLDQVKMIGASMSKGRLVVEGNAGMHVGMGMSGGEINITDDAADWVGPGMTGGRIVVEGNAGHMVGAAYRGSPVGMLGGEIIVHGNVANEAGNGMRRGLIAIGGDSGDFTGVNMLAGTIVVLGQLGMRSAAGMKRGTIVSMRDAQLLPTFTYACSYRPLFLACYLRHLRGRGLEINEQFIRGNYQRWSGDSIELNRGEILLLQQ